MPPLENMILTSHVSLPGVLKVVNGQVLVAIQEAIFRLLFSSLQDGGDQSSNAWLSMRATRSSAASSSLRRVERHAAPKRPNVLLAALQDNQFHL